MQKSRTKSMIGGIVIGVLVGTLIGGYTVAIIMGSAFVGYALKQDEIQNTISVGQATTTSQRTNK
jgi:type IV secretory pathway TrbF-like protein